MKHDDVLSMYLKEINKVPLLTREEEVELAQKAKKGDKAARDKIIKANLRFVVKVAKKCKSTNFLCFTKKFDIVNNYLASGKKLPKNLNVVFSGWDKNFKIDNPYNLPCTYVYFKDTTKNDIPEYSIPCVGSCEKCKSCWTLQKFQSVFFHKH